MNTSNQGILAAEGVQGIVQPELVTRGVRALLRNWCAVPLVESDSGRHAAVSIGGSHGKKGLPDRVPARPSGGEERRGSRVQQQQANGKRGEDKRDHEARQGDLLHHVPSVRNMIRVR